MKRLLFTLLAIAALDAPSHAQTINACVDSHGGLYIASGTPPACGGNDAVLSWSGTGPTAPSSLAAGQYDCVPNQAESPGSAIVFTAGPNNGLIGTTGSQFSSLVLQPGVYQISLTAAGWSSIASGVPWAQITLSPSGLLSPSLIQTQFSSSVSGFLAVTSANTTLQYMGSGQFSGTAGSCQLNIQQL